MSVQDLVEGELVWSGMKVGSLSIKCCYHSFCRNIFLKFQLKGFGSPRLCLGCVFDVVLVKILTMDQPMKRGWQFANRCCRCGSKDKSTCHLLIHCAEACMLWDLVVSGFLQRPSGNFC